MSTCIDSDPCIFARTGHAVVSCVEYCIVPVGGAVSIQETVALMDQVFPAASTKKNDCVPFSENTYSVDQLLLSICICSVHVRDTMTDHEVGALGL